MDCVYFIEVGGEFLTSITFKYFSFEHGFDYLYVGIGSYTEPSRALYTFTGHMGPFTIELFGDLIWVRITSDLVVPDGGASILWHTTGNITNKGQKIT